MYCITLQIHTWSCISAGRPPAWWPAHLSWCSSGCPVSAFSHTSQPSPCGPGWSGRAAPTGETAGPPGRRWSLAGCGAPSSPLSWARCRGRCRWCGWSLYGWRRTGRLQRERKRNMLLRSRNQALVLDCGSPKDNGFIIHVLQRHLVLENCSCLHALSTLTKHFIRNTIHAAFK